VLVAALSGCGADAGVIAGARGPSATPPTSPGTSASPEPPGDPFGPGCGSLESTMAAREPLGMALSGTRPLATFASAVARAGFVEALNGAAGLTVFAPTDDAFAKIPAQRLATLVTDTAALRRFLRAHVLPERLGPDGLVGTHRTSAGGELTVSGSGTDITVGAARVICGNVPASNGAFYLIDAILEPA